MLTISTIIGTSGAIILPEFNTFAVQFGGFGIRWYAIAYLVGLLAGWYLLRREASHIGSPLRPETVDILLNYVLFGIIIGGRLGYILFYNSAYYLAHPLAMLRIWEGGMAFHGALLGVAIAVLIMAKRHHVPFFVLTDRIALVVPIGLFFGRLSNFINGELYGRVTTVPWAMVFPNSDGQPRHPSQLYEAGLEGLLLGVIMLMLWRRGWLQQHGRIDRCAFGWLWGGAQYDRICQRTRCANWFVVKQHQHGTIAVGANDYFRRLSDHAQTGIAWPPSGITVTGHV